MLAHNGPPGTHEEALFLSVGMIIVILSSYLWYAVRSRKVPKINGWFGCLLLGAIALALLSLLSLLGLFAD